MDKMEIVYQNGIKIPWIYFSVETKPESKMSF